MSQLYKEGVVSTWIGSDRLKCGVRELKKCSRMKRNGSVVVYAIAGRGDGIAVDNIEFQR